MPLRSLIYDSLQYKYQKDQIKDRKEKHYCPVITTILYDGYGQWNRNQSLKDMVTVLPEYQEYFHDYKVKVVNVCDISLHTISDQEVRDLIALLQEAQHEKTDIVDLLQKSHLTIDAALYYCAVMGIENPEKYIQKMKGRKTQMYPLLQKYVDEQVSKGMKEGLEEGLEKGIEQGMAKSILIIMDSLGISMIQAMQVMKIPQEDYEKFQTLMANQT